MGAKGSGLSKDRNRGKEELGVLEGEVEHRRPKERFARTLEGVGERS